MFGKIITDAFLGRSGRSAAYTRRRMRFRVTACGAIFLDTTTAARDNPGAYAQVPNANTARRAGLKGKSFLVRRCFFESIRGCLLCALFFLDCELRATFAAAAQKDCAAACCLRAHQKTVRGRAFSLLGLVRLLHMLSNNSTTSCSAPPDSGGVGHQMLCTRNQQVINMSGGFLQVC